jgi:hypothetical protein
MVSTPRSDHSRAGGGMIGALRSLMTCLRNRQPHIERLVCAGQGGGTYLAAACKETFLHRRLAVLQNRRITLITHLQESTRGQQIVVI